MLKVPAFAMIVLAGCVPAAAQELPLMQAPALSGQVAQGAIKIGSAYLSRQVSTAHAEGEIEVAFAPRPEDAAFRLVIKVIEAATQSIEIAAYEMTSEPIAKVLCEAKGRGVQVFAVLDGKENEFGVGIGQRRSQADYLRSCGVFVRRDTHYPIMHHKFIVADSAHVETGSFNFTYSAQRRNAENVIVIWGKAGAPSSLAAIYSKRFLELWNESIDQ